MRINAIDLRQLRYFVFVAEELHFGKAARRLNMSQPPLSQQIKALEEHLGVQLFKRTQRSVELTAAGQHLLPEARRLLQDMERIAEQTKQAEAGQTGFLRIGLNFSAPFHPFTTKLLQAFHTKYPHVRIELVLHEKNNLLELADLSGAQLDAALIWMDEGFKRDDILRLDLATDDLQAAVPAHHPLAKKSKIHISELAALPLIAQPRYAGTQRYEQIIRAFGQISSEPNIVYEAMQMPLVMNMIAAGQGVSLLPSFLADIPMAGVVFRPLVLPKGKLPSMTYNLITPQAGCNPATENLIQVAKDLIRKSRKVN